VVNSRSGLRRQAVTIRAVSDSERVQEFVAEQHAALLRAADVVRTSEDPEGVHDLRVAVRRLRAILRALDGSVEPAWAERVRPELEQLGSAFGPLRDLDVFTAHLRDEAATLEDEDQVALAGVFRELADDHAAARTVALAKLDAALPTIDESLAAPAFADDEIELDGVARKEVRRLRKSMRDESDEALHRDRIRAKRVRYVAEALGEQRVAKRAKALQDAAGEHQDSVVAEERLRALAARVPEASLVIGRLLERERARRPDARSEAQHAWKRLAKAAKAAWS
jgi:CHAD domain-containing protein